MAAFQCDARSAPRLVPWQRWKLDQSGDPDQETVERLLVRDFRYEWLCCTRRVIGIIISEWEE